tara:strand:+ start:5763 stop:6428 length:666 start_codon:yes stop_codon:yes gene_type:complete
LSDFIRYESVGDVSVTELADQIDKVHGALDANRTNLEERQRRRLEPTRNSKKASGRRPSQSSEYAEKMRSLLRDNRPELRQHVSAIMQLIDGAYHFEDGKRLEQRLKKERPDAHKRWLSSFGGNVGEVIIELASTVSGQDEDELLEHLAEHEPPDKSEAIRVLDSLKQRQAKMTIMEEDERKFDLEAWIQAGKQVQQEPDSSGLPERFKKHLIPPRPKRPE